MIGRPDTRYLSQVRKFLFCPRPDQKRLTEKCRSFLEGYRQENPGAGYDDIVSNFGPPADFAGALMADMYPDGVREARERYIKRQKLWLGLAVCLGLLAFAMLLAVILWCYFHEPICFTKDITFS